jgi:hypothetical protein
MLYKITFPYDVEVVVRVNDNEKPVLKFSKVSCVESRYCVYEFDMFDIVLLQALASYNDCRIVVEMGRKAKEYSCNYFIEYLKTVNGEEND